MLLELELVKLIIVEGTEFPRQARGGFGSARADAVMMSVTIPNRSFLGKREAILGFALHFNERIARRE